MVSLVPGVGGFVRVCSVVRTGGTEGLPVFIESRVDTSRVEVALSVNNCSARGSHDVNGGLQIRMFVVF